MKRKAILVMVRRNVAIRVRAIPFRVAPVTGGTFRGEYRGKSRGDFVMISLDCVAAGGVRPMRFRVCLRVRALAPRAAER